MRPEPRFRAAVPLTYAEELLRRVLREMPVLSCSDFGHHLRDDLHGDGEPCPPLLRLEAATKQAEAYLAARLQGACGPKPVLPPDESSSGRKK